MGDVPCEVYCRNLWWKLGGHPIGELCFNTWGIELPSTNSILSLQLFSENSDATNRAKAFSFLAFGANLGNLIGELPSESPRSPAGVLQDLAFANQVPSSEAT